jgi:NTE family protein
MDQNVTPLKPTVAAVLPGGGARGAYEVGALSVLLPALEERGERVSVWCGTSVGAINAAAFASLSDRPAAEQAASATALWTRMRKRDVVSPLVGIGGVRTLARAVTHTLGLPGLGVASIFDPSPMAQSIDRWVNWSALEANIESEVVKAACVVATSVTTGEPVAFVASKRPQRQLVDDQIRYVQTRLTGEHVRASAAIPVLFPTVEITTPRSARGHYADGGTRLNSPIKRVIVIGFEPFNAVGAKPLPPREPNLADVASNILDGLLVDQVAHDLRRLALINSFFVEDAISGTMRAPRAYRLARGQQPYRPISYALVAPRRRGEIGRLAQDVFRRRYGGLRGLRDPDYLVISRALGGDSRARGELLSFLLFDPEFTRALIELGRRDAARWLRRHPRFWCRDASHDLSVGAVDRELLKEQDTLEEFRSHHHRN